MNYLESFKSWLMLQNLNPNTIRSYTSDINQYLQSTPESQAFSQKSINAYIAKISQDENSSRYISALNKFCEFAIDQGIIKNNIAKSNNSLQETKTLIEKYKLSLFKKNKSPKTVENYSSDIYQFIDWLNQNAD